MQLEMQNVSFAHGGTPVLKDVSFTLRRGERVGLIAPSGYGKTTFVRLLAGYERPDTGQVLLDGRPLPRKGMLPVQLIGQHPELCVNPRWRMGQVLEEAALAGARYGAQAKAKGSRGLAHSPGGGKLWPPQKACATPDAALLEALGIQPEWLGRFARELSGGELQRFCVARALLCGAPFLVADEISTMLDVITQAQLWQLLLRQAGERELGLLVVTHSPALARRVCGRVVDLRDINQLEATGESNAKHAETERNRAG